jgi:hydroxymethylglutaryl-CoA lyase
MIMGNESVTIVEVGPRDGLQYESVFFPTGKKIELIDRLSESGLTRIEATSFVHPKIIPGLRDAVDVLNGINKAPGVTYSALVPNLKGCQRALETPVDQIALFVSASETHNQKNVGMSIKESLANFSGIAKLCQQAGKSVRGYVVTAFGCPYEGRIPQDKVLNIIEEYAGLGVEEVSLGDTTGMANPRMVGEVFAQLSEMNLGAALAAHFHNSRGLGLANAYAAYEAGCRVFDSSIGGLGGCPTAVGAMGNIPTEDLVNLMEEMGVSTGTGFDALMNAAGICQQVLGGELASYTHKQGRPAWDSIRG